MWAIKNELMENYTKGEVKEVEEAPVFPLDETGVLMRVTGGSKIRNLMGFAMKKIKEPNTKKIAWNGSGNAITKTISCAEIMKRRIKGLHQITKVRYRRVEEYWEPKVEGLERLKVNKDIPAISILLSKEELDKSNPGYQAPGCFDEFWKEIVQTDKRSRNQKSASGKRLQAASGSWIKGGKPGKSQGKGKKETYHARNTKMGENKEKMENTHSDKNNEHKSTTEGNKDAQGSGKKDKNRHDTEEKMDTDR